MLNALNQLRGVDVGQNFLAPLMAQHAPQNALSPFVGPRSFAGGFPSYGGSVGVSAGPSVSSPDTGDPRRGMMGTGASGQSTGGNVEYLRRGLIERGMSPMQAAAFLGNIQVESGFDAGINEIAPLVPGSRGGFGLIQWTGPRRRQLEAYAADRGANVADVDMQLDFLMHELQTTERSAWDRIRQATSVDDAARLVSQRFLRPGIPHLDRRISAANSIYGG